jgi:Na+-transporting NADH:ubiquinone oxidoreductase subunit NqrA
LTGVADRTYVTITLSNITSSISGADSAAIRLGFLRGDVNHNRVVSVADIGLVNSQLAQAVSAANFLKDVNASGTLTIADLALVNANLTRALPAP